MVAIHPSTDRDHTEIVAIGNGINPNWMARSVEDFRAAIRSQPPAASAQSYVAEAGGRRAGDRPSLAQPVDLRSKPPRVVRGHPGVSRRPAPRHCKSTLRVLAQPARGPSGSACTRTCTRRSPRRSELCCPSRLSGNRTRQSSLAPGRPHCQHGAWPTGSRTLRA